MAAPKTCPKCGGGRFRGPVYTRHSSCLDAPWASDWLLYQCVNCGYEHREPPRDRATPKAGE